MKKILLALLSLSCITIALPAEALQVCKGDDWKTCRKIGGGSSGKIEFLVHNTGRKPLEVEVQGSSYYVKGCSSRGFTIRTKRESSRVFIGTNDRYGVDAKDGREYSYWYGPKNLIVAPGVNPNRTYRGEPRPGSDSSCF